MANWRLLAILASAIPMAAQALSFPDFSDVSGLTLNGAAQRVGTVLRLTPAAQSQSGSTYGTVPVTLGPGGTFQTNFRFQISSPCGITETDGQGADGFAFVLQNNSPFSLGTTGGWLAYDGLAPSVAVEFDTWYNGPTFGDEDGNHIGIDINGSLVSVSVAPVSARMNDADLFEAQVAYDGTTLRVTVAKDGGGSWSVSHVVDVDGILGGQTAYVGFTSGTGSACGNHDILNWYFGPLFNVEIDVIPGSDINPINTGSRGLIPVAILTTEEFDALEVDVSTIEFGPGAAPIAHVRAHVEDVDMDGDLDLLLHFEVASAAIEIGHTEACLRADTISGVPIESCDNVTIVPPTSH